MWAILVAAGMGERMGSQLPKQYLPLSGKTIVERSLRLLEQSGSISGITVVLASTDQHWQALNIQCSKPIRTTPGGKQRADSVLAGLESIATECGKDDWVLVHDAARPCLNSDVIDHIESALMGHACGGLLAIPVRDTLKRANANGDAIETLDRESVWQAQTPQVFRYELLKNALITARANGVNVTDEAMAMELAGHHPRLIEGPADNIKITVPADITYAEYLLDKKADSKGGA